MSYVIALAGKGGTGKTTIAALIVRIIKENKMGSVLAVDADPNSNLAEALGVALKKTVGEILDEIAKSQDKIPSGMSKERLLEYEVQAAISEGDGFDLLAMGRPEGPGCYCYVNNVLRGIVAKLTKDYDYVVVDNEAGLEHLSRRTMRACDTLLVVSDSTPAGLRAAQRIGGLADELQIKIGRRLLIINRSSGAVEKEKFKGINLDYAGNIPDDNEIEDISLDGGSLINLKDNALGLAALRKLGEKLWN